jgi:hypothetical protein
MSITSVNDDSDAVDDGDSESSWVSGWCRIWFGLESLGTRSCRITPDYSVFNCPELNFSIIRMEL